MPKNTPDTGADTQAGTDTQSGADTQAGTDTQSGADTNTAEDAASADVAPANETKAQAFVRLAQKRVSNLSHAYKLLAPLVNKANYEYVPAHWEAIFAQIDKDYAGLKEAVAGVKKGPIGFDLSSIPVEPPKGDDTQTGADTQSA